MICTAQCLEEHCAHKTFCIRLPSVLNAIPPNFISARAGARMIRFCFHSSLLAKEAMQLAEALPQELLLRPESAHA
uniref:Uncharacterized protein n=1 Tax=Trichuris muris TaxID=70415 RepID=A0A5S6QTR8_TRIMR